MKIFIFKLPLMCMERHINNNEKLKNTKNVTFESASQTICMSNWLCFSFLSCMLISSCLWGEKNIRDSIQPSVAIFQPNYVINIVWSHHPSYRNFILLNSHFFFFAFQQCQLLLAQFWLSKWPRRLLQWDEHIKYF